MSEPVNEKEVRAKPIVRNLQQSMGLEDGGSWALSYSYRILDDPQAHVDALVEAGVLVNAEALLLPGSGKLIGEWYAVVRERKPCPAWIEVGFGRESCVEEAGHDTGEHPTPHRSRRASSRQDGLVAMDTLWLSGS